MPLNWCQLIRPTAFIAFASMFGFVCTEIVVSPKDVDAVLGTSVTFNCSSSIQKTDVQWVHYPNGKDMQGIYAYGKVIPQYANRFTVIDGHNLHISSVTVDDVGTYECQDDYGDGEKHSAELIVLESNPICQSSSSSSLHRIVGKNSCGIEPTQVTLSCIVQFHGNKAPTLEWKRNGDENPITIGIKSVIKGNLVLHNLTTKGDSIINGSSFSCSPANAQSASVTCNSGTVTTLGKFQADTTSHDEYEFNKGWFAIICAVILALCVGVTSFFIWKLRKQNTTLKEEFESHLYPKDCGDYVQEPSHITDIKTHENKCVHGMTVLENHLFVVHQDYAEVEVYDLTNTCNVEFLRKFEIPNITNPFGVVCVKDEKYLFIIGQSNNAKNATDGPLLYKANARQEEVSKCIIVRIDVDGNLFAPWPKPADEFQGRLATYGSNLVVCYTNNKVIKEFSRDGDVLHTVKLSRTGIGSPAHAIKVSSIHFAVIHLEEFVKRSGICVVDLSGKIVKSCPDAEKTTIVPNVHFKVPIYLMDDRERSLLVLERETSKVLLFNSALKYQGELIKLESNLDPVRICFNETQDLIFVASKEKGSFKPCPIQVFKVRQ